MCVAFCSFILKKVDGTKYINCLISPGLSFSFSSPLVRYQSHRWTVYVRGATNEDLGVVVKRAVFQLHSSFNNPTRVIDRPPFELSESGWGEFEIAITLHFHSDVGDKPLHLWVVLLVIVYIFVYLCVWMLYVREYRLTKFVIAVALC